MTEKEMTKEEQEKLIAEKLKKDREVALETLDSSLWNYAAPNLVTREQYGKLSDVSEVFYRNAISKAPEQIVYEKLFLPQLKNEGGAITSPYLKNKSYEILEKSFQQIKIEDALNIIGKKGNVKEELKDKYLGMLQDKEGNNPLSELLMAYKSSEMVEKIVEEGKNGVASALEEIILEKPKKKEEKKE